MATPSDEIVRQISETRGEMESRILELRERGRRTVNRTRRLAVIGAGVAAGALLAVGIGVAVYRMTRPPTVEERLLRVLPGRLQGLRGLGRLARVRLQEGLPPMRLYVGDRQVGEEPPSTRWEKIGIRFAQTFASAAAGAFVNRFMQRLSPRR